MKKAALLVIGGTFVVIAGAITVIAGVLTLIRNLPPGPGGRLARLPGAMIGRMMEHMPDN